MKGRVIQQVHSKLRYGKTVFSYHLHPGTNHQIPFCHSFEGWNYNCSYEWNLLKQPLAIKGSVNILCSYTATPPRYRLWSTKGLSSSHIISNLSRAHTVPLNSPHNHTLLISQAGGTSPKNNTPHLEVHHKSLAFGKVKNKRCLTVPQCPKIFQIAIILCRRQASRMSPMKITLPAHSFEVQATTTEVLSLA